MSHDIRSCCVEPARRPARRRPDKSRGLPRRRPPPTLRGGIDIGIILSNHYGRAVSVPVTLSGRAFNSYGTVTRRGQFRLRVSADFTDIIRITGRVARDGQSARGTLLYRDNAGSRFETRMRTPFSLTRLGR